MVRDVYREEPIRDVYREKPAAALVLVGQGLLQEKHLQSSTGFKTDVDRIQGETCHSLALRPMSDLYRRSNFSPALGLGAMADVYREKPDTHWV